MSEDLLVVGAGVLGSLVAKSWTSRHPSARIVCETRSRTRHETLKTMGFETRVEKDEWTSNIPGNVVVTVSPSGNDDYVGVVRKAVSLWEGTEKGALVFTSSSSVYSVENGKIVTERSQVGGSDRAKRLLKAEEVVLEKGGCVVRLAGLYLLNRGPHSAYLKSGKVRGGRNGVVNLVCYDDAAEMVVNVLEKKPQGKIFLCADGNPITRQEIVEAAKGTDTYRGLDVTEWGDDDKSVKKRLDNSWSRQELGWKPKYVSFQEYMKLHQHTSTESKVTAPT